MTEAEWLACEDPRPMLEFLRDTAGERKLRLFAVLCCRHVWTRLTEGGRHAVEVAERFADGLMSRKNLRLAEQIAGEVRDPIPAWGGEHACACCAADKSAWEAASGAARTSQLVFSSAWDVAAREADRTRRPADREAVGAVAERERGAARQAQIALLVDIFGNPFRPVAFDPAWRTETAVALARGIYDDRAFDRLPVLADALDDAGCDHPDVIGHCRGPGPHARGCWVVDGVLGLS